MAPKNKKQTDDGDELDAQMSAALEETKRLTGLAYDQGILSKAKTLNARTLKPNKGECGMGEYQLSLSSLSRSMV
jgi:hypothetical protein